MPLIPSQETKYAQEILDFSIDFMPRIKVGSTISSASGVVSPGVSLTIANVAPSGTDVNFRITGGVATEFHNVDVTATMDSGEKLTHRVVVTVI